MIFESMMWNLTFVSWKFRDFALGGLYDIMYRGISFVLV